MPYICIIIVHFRGGAAKLVFAAPPFGVQPKSVQTLITGLKIKTPTHFKKETSESFMN